MQKYVLLCILVLLLSGCTTITTSPSEDVYVDLNDLQPLPAVPEEGIQPLRVAISAVISPQGSAESYAPLLEYLEHELGRPVVAEQRRTYSEVNKLIEHGEVDLGFVCTSQYIAGSQSFGMELLVAPQVNGESVYRAEIIVPVTSSATKLEDLRWGVFAYTDPISFTGRVYPTYLLQQMGEESDKFFSRTFFTYSHDDAIYAVANGVADGASVDALVLDFALNRDPELKNKIRIIHTSEPFGIPPVVVGPHVRPQLKAELEELLLNIHLTPEGQAALKVLDYDRFVLIFPEAYSSAVLIEEVTGITFVDEQ
jgi:phosphonate transport system substrate-binding protein